MFGFLSTLTLALLGSAAAQFTITSPTSEIFWVSPRDRRALSHRRSPD